MGYRYEERFRALQPGDIRGAVLLYGVPRPAAAIVAARPEPGSDPQAVSTPPVGRALGK
jgi:hypothetical protein